MEDEQRSLVSVLSSANPEKIRRLHSRIAPESMPDDMKKVIRTVVLEERMLRLVTSSYTMAVRGDLALGSVAIAALTNHWEIAFVGIGLWGGASYLRDLFVFAIEEVKES